MTGTTTAEWFRVWERVRLGQNSAVEFPPSEQLRLFTKHVSHIESRALDLGERLESKNIWIGAATPRSEAVCEIRNAICQLETLPGAPRPACQVAIGGDRALLLAAVALNEARERFRQFCLKCDARRLGLTYNHRQLFRSVYSVQAELCGRPNFDYLLAYQQLSIVTGLPRCISFNQEIACRTRRIDREEVLKTLGNKCGEAAARDVERVRSTPATEREFAMHGSTGTANRVAIVFDGVDALGALRRGVRTNLPIVFRSGRSAPTMVFCGDAGVRGFRSRKRPVSTICADRFLETLPVHRYLHAR